MAKQSENSKAIWAWLKENATDADYTTKQVAEGAGVSPQAVTGTFNGIVRKGLGERIEVDEENDKQKVVTVKYLHVNEDFFDYDPEAE